MDTEQLLGDRGDVTVTLGGEGALPGKRRKPPDDKRIARRVAKFCERHAAAECPEGVQSLNRGFFELERMRLRNVADAKARAKKRGKVRGK